MEIMESARLSDFARAASGALIACATIICLALFPIDAHAASKSDLDHHKKWWGWAEVGGFYDSEYDGELEVELFFPIAQSAYSLLFLDIEGELLIISQFTLLADTRKGRRPSFIEAAPPAEAEELFRCFVEQASATGLKVETGRFQQYMQVEIHNDGPVTILLDTG